MRLQQCVCCSRQRAAAYLEPGLDAAVVLAVLVLAPLEANAKRWRQAQKKHLSGLVCVCVCVDRR